eukprot:8365265-Pyramimonas_sp.AAC.1
MTARALPAPGNRGDGADERATRVAEDVQRRYEALAALGPDELKALVEAQRTSWKAKKEDGAEPSPDCPPPPAAEDSGCPSGPQNNSAPNPRRADLKAYFAPSDAWRRPSDYVAHLAK